MPPRESFEFCVSETAFFAKDFGLQLSRRRLDNAAPLHFIIFGIISNRSGKLNNSNFLPKMSGYN